MKISKMKKPFAMIAAFAGSAILGFGFAQAALPTSVGFEFSVSAAKPVQHSAAAVKTSNEQEYGVTVRDYANMTEIPRLRVRAYNLTMKEKASIFYSVDKKATYTFDYTKTATKSQSFRLDGDVSANANTNGGYMAGTFTP